MVNAHGYQEITFPTDASICSVELNLSTVSDSAGLRARLTWSEPWAHTLFLGLLP